MHNRFLPGELRGDMQTAQIRSNCLTNLIWLWLFGGAVATRASNHYTLNANIQIIVWNPWNIFHPHSCSYNCVDGKCFTAFIKLSSVLTAVWMENVLQLSSNYHLFLQLCEWKMFHGFHQIIICSYSCVNGKCFTAFIKSSSVLTAVWIENVSRLSSNYYLNLKFQTFNVLVWQNNSQL